MTNVHETSARRHSCTLPLSSAILLFALPPLFASADIITVDDDGPADFDNIQAAVNAAADGDEIRVEPGTYTFEEIGQVVDMDGKAVRLISTAGAASTFIDGQGQRRGIICFTDEGPDTVINGFTIRNGNCVEHDYDGNGIIYWIGTKYGEAEEWRNPTAHHTKGGRQRRLINVESSEIRTVAPEYIVQNETCVNVCVVACEGAWASIEFVDDIMVKPTKYTLSHSMRWTGMFLPSWKFEGSRDGKQWTLIKEHSKKELEGRSDAETQSNSWSTPNLHEYFNRFRVRAGMNSNGEFYGCQYLMGHALEIYGFVQDRRCSL